MKFFRLLSNARQNRKKKKIISVRNSPDGNALKDVLKIENKRVVTAVEDEWSLSCSSESNSPTTLNSNPAEWKLSTFDEKVTQPQTMEQELLRLKNLQQYFILDSNAEEEFDCITRLASTTFNTSIALVSLVDLGRQWFMSKVGLDVNETPRNMAFCSHVVVHKLNLLVVPDASKDFRFKNNPLVTGAPNIRFYAGAALVSPEGFKLGSLCVISPHDRPEGLSEKEQSMLHGMAKMVVNTMVARRERLIKKQNEQKMKDIGFSLAHAASSMSKTRSLLATIERSDSQAVLKQISDTLRVQSQVYNAAARSLLKEDEAKEDTTDRINQLDWLESSLDSILEPKTNLKTLVSNLGTVLESFPRKGPVTLELDASCPEMVIAEDLLVFRSALNLVSNSMQRVKDKGEVHFRIRQNKKYLLFETEDSGTVVTEERAKKAFREQDTLLGPLATMARTMGGSCGMRRGRFSFSEEEPPLFIFWFRVPLELPDSMELSSNKKDGTSSKGLTVMLSPKAAAVFTKKNDGIEDPFQRALIESGCLSF